MRDRSFSPKVVEINCVNIDELNVTCSNCHDKLYIWFSVNDGLIVNYKLCIKCKNLLLTDEPVLDFHTLNNFFLVIFDTSILLKRIGHLLLITNTNRRIIEGGLISRDLKLLNLRPLIEAGLNESLINKALEFSKKYGKKI